MIVFSFEGAKALKELTTAVKFDKILVVEDIPR